jgi:hypothetical protein
MKTVKWLISIGVIFPLFATVVKGFTIDGTLDAGYGSAIATQVLGTADSGGLKNTVGDIGGANGSELDAAYGVINNGVLYLFFAGNIDTGADPVNLCTNGCNTYDKLNVFFMADSGAGGDNPLGTNYNGNADGGGINRMGIGGNGADAGSSGLTFDSGFTANYWVGVTVGGNTNVTAYANYEVICSGCYGAYIGNAGPTNVITDNSGGGNDSADVAAGVQVALNNSNTNGVWGDSSGCYMYAFGGSTNNPLAVTNGVEMAIPLGMIGSPLSSVSICAFLTKSDYSSVYNNVLDPVWDGTTNYCIANLSADGDSSEVNFQSLPGKHYFSIPVPSCNSIQVSPSSASYSTSVGTGTVSVTMDGGCGWTASTSTSWVSIISGGSGSGSGGVITYAVATNTTINARTANLYVVGTSVPVTQTVTITQLGITLPPLGAIVVDGTLDPGYGCPLAVQAIGTGYGKDLSGSVSNNSSGSELDAAYGLVQNNILFLFLAGNLQDNNNEVHIFFMTGPGGTNTLNSGLVSGQVTNIGGNLLNVLGGTATNATLSATNGLTFDTGFAPNYWLGINISTPYHFFVDFAQLWPGGTNAAGMATNGYFIGGSATAANGTLIPGASGNPYHVQGTINNSNTNGVDGSSCVTNTTVTSAYYQMLNSVGAAAVTNGIELAIPLGQFGSPTGQIAVCAFLGNNSGLYMSNQLLPPINPIGTTNSWCPVANLANSANASFVNFGTLPGGPHYFTVGPEMRVTGVSVVGSNVAVAYLPENNTNLLYQLQRTFAPLKTNSVWANVGGLTNGGPAVISATDLKAATNKVGVIYRVRQSPNCSVP